MKKARLSLNAKINDLSFDELYDELSADWQLKAEKLQARRLKKIRQKENFAF